MAFDKKGTHSLQTVISVCSLDSEVKLIVSAVEPEALALALNHNGTHFLQKCITCFDQKSLQNIAASLTTHYVELANNAQGLCVLKVLMNKFGGFPVSPQASKFLALAVQHVEVLIQSPFGNYAIQHTYDIFGFEKCAQLTEKILKKLVQFSSQKFSSNVIEKLVSNHH